MHETPCGDLQASADLLHREADAAMWEAKHAPKGQGAFLSLVQLAAKCEAIAGQVEERIEEDC